MSGSGGANLLVRAREDPTSSLLRLRGDPLAGGVTASAIGSLERLFAAGPEALGSTMAGRAEEGVGDPALVAASVAALADPAYASPDTYPGPGGITWLHRWAITRGVDRAVFAGEPEAPDRVER